MGDGFYRSKDPINSIKVLKEKATKEKSENANNKIIYTYTIIHIKKGYRYTYKANKSPSLHLYGVTRGLPQRAGSLGLNGGEIAATVPPVV